MVSTQLMLGDWVFVAEYDEYTPAPYNKPYPVQILHGVDIDRADEISFEPIPLTKRILRKNGFKPYENESNIYERVDAYEGIYFRIEVHFDRFLIYLYATYHNGQCQIHKNNTIEGCEMYVHELQQAMRLVGLTEIANNFKL